MSRIIVELVPGQPGELDELFEVLTSSGGVDDVELQQGDDAGLAAETALLIIVLGSAGLAAVTQVVDWLRDRRDCLLVVDARGGDLKIQERCDIVGRRGQVVIVTPADQHVVIHKQEAPLDLQAIVAQAIDRSAAAAVQLAAAAGATAYTEPRGAGL